MGGVPQVPRFEIEDRYSPTACRGAPSLGHTVSAVPTGHERRSPMESLVPSLSPPRSRTRAALALRDRELLRNGWRRSLRLRINAAETRPAAAPRSRKAVSPDKHLGSPSAAPRRHHTGEK
jgi:hypothetical protein